MATKTKEIRSIKGEDHRHDPHCRACKLPPPKNTIRADRLWEWSLNQAAGVKPFRSQNV